MELEFKNVMDEMKFLYKEVIGEVVFYGLKLDI